MMRNKLLVALGLVTLSSTMALATTYPLTIETYNHDRQKITQTFQKAPERVYAQNQNNIETLLALGLKDKIVGAYGLDDPTVSVELQDDFKTINYYDKFPGKEAIIALQPDFLTGWFSSFGDKNLGDASFWNERGANIYMSLNSSCRGPVNEAPQKIDHELEDVRTLGKIFDVEDKAEALIKSQEEALAAIDKKLEGKTRLTAAVLEDEGGSFRVYGHNTLGGNVAEHGGAVLSVGKEGEENKNISAEDLVVANPDAIFMVWYDGYDVDGKEIPSSEIVKLITDKPQFASLKAVQNGRVYPINLSGIYCSGLRSVKGAKEVFNYLYPELNK